MSSVSLYMVYLLAHHENKVKGSASIDTLDT